ncbi:Methionine--tRNA ligase [Tsuneonella dongtanensis]|uniref:Methionine--tRNA ligase n=1 Tax=Tsuneonella dongtanensis TaxID=692370 RepID=A0A1B2AEV2_9SPHN|nr:methionine--tRNA ligase [Tsuneonella dongtanensis]ANY20656.1 Methionine--tRNA ligase [Tsuneonella dongtanensis]
MPDPYYLTTAISYPNGPPHIGHAYEAIAADVIARTKRAQGYDVRLVTGTDEHGLKMAKTARDAGRDTLEFATEMSNYFREMCAALHIDYSAFRRTTEDQHHAASQAIWQAMADAGDLYLDRYEGWYSVRDEAFYGEGELIEGEGGAKLSPQGTPVEWQVEESWFFRLSKYRDYLIELNETPGFLEPESRRNEVLAFLKGNDLRDLSVSRTSFDWGVPVPGSPGHVMYVWVDALTTYLTGIGFPDREGDFARFWPANLHLIGKDIVRFHAVYWPAFLKSAGLPAPKAIFGHGFLLHRGEKMSKSTGNVVDPLELAERYGVDQLRYFLLAEVPFGKDGSFSAEAIVTRCNAELANSFGNLAQRVLSMIFKNLDGALRADLPVFDADTDLSDFVAREIGTMHERFEELAFSEGIEAWMRAVFACNAYVDDQAPWALRKTDPERMTAVLMTLVRQVRDLAIAIRPVVPSSIDRLLDQMGIAENARDFAALANRDWLSALGDFRLSQPIGVFPRLELAEDEPA